MIDAAKAYAYTDSRLNQVSGDLNYKFEERFVNNIVPVWNDLETFILNAGEDYSHQVLADFALVQGDMLDGKLVDVSTLDNLEVSTGALTPAFDPGVTQYSVAVGHDVDTIGINVTPTDIKAAIVAAGQPYTSGTVQSYNLAVGKNEIPFTVTARNGSTKTYTVTVNRADANGTDPTTPTPTPTPTPTSGSTNPTSSPATPTPTPSAPSKQTGTVGNTGGDVTLNGVKINVPNGATENGTTITVAKFSNPSVLFSNNSSLRLLGEVYELTKNKAGEFGKAITITLPFDKNQVDLNKSALGLYWFNEQSKQWVALDHIQVDRENGTVSGTVNHFTKFAVLTSDKPAEPDTSAEPNLSDIQGHWGEASIKSLVSLGAIQGYPDNAFKPDNRITRAEFVSIIVKAFHLQGVTDKVYSDTKTHWASNAIATAAGLGIVNGYADGSFGPDEWVTREQVAAIVVRAAELATSNQALSFTDRAQVSPWAASALSSAAAQGLVNGYTDGTLKPKGSTTRAEAATIILRALQLKK